MGLRTIGFGGPRQGGGFTPVLPTLPNGLVGYWKLEDVAPGDTLDSVGVAHGQCFGVITKGVTGQVGNAFRFIAGCRVVIIQLGMIRTISFWAKRDTFTALTTLYNDFGGLGGLYCPDDTGLISYLEYTGASWLAEWPGVWTDKLSFHHITLVTSVVGTLGIMELYFDGISAGIKNCLAYNLDRIQFGWNSNSTGSAFLGDMDELKHWNRALTPAEITEDFNNGINHLPLL